MMKLLFIVLAIFSVTLFASETKGRERPIEMILVYHKSHEYMLFHDPADPEKDFKVHSPCCKCQRSKCPKHKQEQGNLDDLLTLFQKRYDLRNSVDEKTVGCS